MFKTAELFYKVNLCGLLFSYSRKNKLWKSEKYVSLKMKKIPKMLKIHLRVLFSNPFMMFKICFNSLGQNSFLLKSKIILVLKNFSKMLLNF